MFFVHIFPSVSSVKSVSGPMASTATFKFGLKILKSHGPTKGGGHSGPIKSTSIFVLFSHIFHIYFHKKVVFLVSRHDCNNIFLRLSQKNLIRPKTAFLAPKRTILGNRGQKTVRRAAKRLSTKNTNVSRVTSGYGGDMIPLSHVRLTQFFLGYIGVA